MLALLPVLCFAGTSTTTISNIAYTQITGPSGNGYAITPYLLSQCVFATSQPSVSTVGHKIAAGETLSVDLMGSGIYLWCKSDSTVIGANFITITPASDAGIGGNSASTATTNVDLKKVGGTSYSLGQNTMIASAPVVIASNQSAVPISGTVTASGTVAATQSGTWTVQPGNTANTTAWKVDGSSVTQPISGTVTLTPPTAASATVINVDSTAYEASHVISGSAATLLGCVGYNSKTSTQYILFFNSASVPVDGTAPTVAAIAVGASSSFAIDFGVYGRPFSTGIAVSNSSTANTKTIGSSDVWYSCRIK